MKHFLILSLMSLIFAGCAGKKVTPEAEGIVPPAMAVEPTAADPCIAADKVILVNNFSKTDLPVLISTDHKLWKTVNLKGGEKTQLDAVKAKGKKGAKSEALVYVNHGSETAMIGGNFYSISLAKDSLAVNRVPTNCENKKK